MADYISKLQLNKAEDRHGEFFEFYVRVLPHGYSISFKEEMTVAEFVKGLRKFADHLEKRYPGNEKGKT